MKLFNLIGIFSFFCLWFILTYSGFVNPLFIPSPLDVLKQIPIIIKEGFIIDIIYTMFRLIAGFIIGSLLGIGLGILMGYYKNIYNLLETLVDFFRSVPVTSLFPLFLLFFGIGDIAKILIAAWSSSLIILINTMYGVKNANKLKLLVGQLMGANSYKLLKYIIIPDALPDIVVGLRTGVSLALIVVVVSEMFLGTKYGLGQIIYNSSLLYETPTMYAAIIFTGLIGYGLNKIFIHLEKRIVHWN
jgi:NitT/TauT family transport system permease protein